MAEWLPATWGDVITLQRGYDITRRQQSLAGTIPVVSSGGISSHHDTSMSDGPGVVIGRKGTLGRVHYVDGPFWPHDTTLWVRDFKGNDPRFVYYALTSMNTVFLNVGSASPTLNRNHVHPLPVLWPADVGEQRAIAEVLGALDDKIAANAQLISLTDELLAQQFAAQAATRGRVPLGKISAVNSVSIKPVPGGSLRYIDISSVRQGAYDYPGKTSWDSAPGRARRAVKAGDTVWSTVRPNRRSHAFVLDDDPLLVASTGLAVLTPRSGHAAGVFEASRMAEFEAYLLSVAEGSAYPAVRAERFLDAPVPDLPETEWDRFESLAWPLRKRAHAATVESRRLVNARDALLPLLMSGKVRVRDAERVVSDTV